ncbi:MAG: leucine-rich repeat domain-containing protein, partial [Ureaplasma sp.]|nr:leucine-rich repeat domain-containing protein [Ureaplasma sp.]
MIQIEGIKYYEDLNITWSNLSNLKAVFQEFVDSNNYNTIDFFSAFQELINNDLDSLKNIVANQLNISSSEVGKIEINDFEIIISAGNYKRFFLTDIESNLILQNHRIHLSGFNCNGEVFIPEWRLILLTLYIQNYIYKNNETPESWNKSMENSFTGPLLLEGYSWILDVNSSYIGATLAVDKAVIFAAADGITFDSTQVTHEYIIDGQIVLPLEFFTGKISPDSCFTWNGNIITGLTAEGRSKKELILPSRVTGIASNTIFHSSNLLTLDLSQTKITSLPDYNQTSGLISGCTQLNNVLLPDTLTTIGSYVFANCNSSNLKIRMPKSINAIGIGAFANLPTTIKIEIPLFD